jgi:hypothetical protein
MRKHSWQCKVGLAPGQDRHNDVWHTDMLACPACSFMTCCMVCFALQPYKLLVVMCRGAGL